LRTVGKTLKEDKAMSEVTDRKFTMLDKSDLEEFIKAYDRSHGPVFGQYPPNLYFSQQQQQAADADQQARPDDFYYQGQGQEPPPPPKRHWLHWFVRNYELCVTLVAVAGFLIILALCQV
jgi:hypothetical protein